MYSIHRHRLEPKCRHGRLKRVQTVLHRFWWKTLRPGTREEQKTWHRKLDMNVNLSRDEDCHHRVLIQESLHIRQQFRNVCFPPCSPSLSTNEGFLPAWRWKVFARHPHMRGKSPPDLGIGLTYVDVESWQGWFRHTGGFVAFPVMQIKSSGLTLHSNDANAERMAWLCFSSELLIYLFFIYSSSWCGVPWRLSRVSSWLVWWPEHWFM